MASDDAARTTSQNALKPSERRYFPRWETENRILYSIEDDKTTHECTSKDINCTGLCFVTDEPLVPNQNLKLKVYLNEDISITVKGKISWTKPMDNQTLIGVNFSWVTDRIQETILKYAFELDKEKLVKHWYEGWSKNSPGQ